MSGKKIWLVVAVLAAGTGVLAQRHLTSPTSLHAAQRRTEPAVGKARAENPKLTQRVADPRSPEFRAWLAVMHEADLEVDRIIDLLESPLSDAQKNALLEEQLEKSATADSISSPERWRDRLSKTVMTTDIDLDLGGKTGRILGKVSSAAQLSELEAEYKRRGSTMKPGNKLAIVTASRNPEFVGEVLKDDEEPIDVRERAIQRLADMGNVKQVHEVLAEGSKADPVLKVTALGTLAQDAGNPEELHEVVERSKSHTEHDSFGRSALAIAQVGASESNVDGKSVVLFGEWQAGLASLGARPSEAQLMQTLVAGKALSRAIWTESDVGTASRLIDGQLSALIATMLKAASPGQAPAELQVLAEFASDFFSECQERAPAACSVQDDRRLSYRVQLSAAIRPRLAGTELAFYIPRLGA